MTWLERMTEALISRLPSRRRTGIAAPTPEGIRFEAGAGERVVPWDDIDRVVAVRDGPNDGATLALLFSFHGQTATFTQDDPNWQAITSALAGHLPGARPYPDWALALEAAGIVSVDVFRRW